MATRPTKPNDRGTCLTAAELVASQDVRPIDSVDELATDLWSSDAELDTFIADVRRARNADHA